ncbi:MAG: hypothetical protein ACM3TT_08915 [Syntrophothermus sp.]
MVSTDLQRSLNDIFGTEIGYRMTPIQEQRTRETMELLTNKRARGSCFIWRKSLTVKD